MIISKMVGGLGNQMFQYAYARHLSLITENNFYLDTNFYTNQIGVTPREFLLDQFPHTITNTNVPNTLYTHIVDDFYYKKLDALSGDYYLDGYWQSEKYFMESRSQIMSDFSPTAEFIIESRQKHPELKNNALSIHIRRGDYLNSNGYHPIQTMEYYKNAIDIVGGYDNIFVFSDDIEWCKNNLDFTDMIFVEHNSELEDLWLMSLCKNNIIVNSSFSWWGAYLNISQNKKIIAPSKWFGVGVNLNSSEIVPEVWHRI